MPGWPDNLVTLDELDDEGEFLLAMPPCVH